MISICINTKNRPQQLLSCLDSINQNKYSDFEIIIIDQGQSISRDIPEILSNEKIKYFINKHISVGAAKNLAISKARGDIIAFTDDDCLVEKNWLEKINLSFKKNKDIIGLFGQVIPYSSDNNTGKICPSNFTKKQKRLITKPCLHWKNVGLGNNMAFGKEVFKKSGGFKKWLGPGSIAGAAEDGELTLRILSKGYKILYEPEAIVYHNRWLTKDEYRRQCLSYSCGEVACYGYFAFQGYQFAKQIVSNNFQDSYWKLKKSIKLIMLLKDESTKFFLNSLEELFYRLKGLIVAFWYAKKEPLIKTDN